jgi:hypothetical protein
MNRQMWTESMEVERIPSRCCCVRHSHSHSPSDPEELRGMFTSEADYIINFAVELPHPGSRKLIMKGAVLPYSISMQQALCTANRR